MISRNTPSPIASTAPIAYVFYLGDTISSGFLTFSGVTMANAGSGVVRYESSSVHVSLLESENWSKSHVELFKSQRPSGP